MAAAVAAGSTGNVDIDAMEAEIDGLRYQKKEYTASPRRKKPSDNIKLA